VNGTWVNESSETNHLQPTSLIDSRVAAEMVEVAAAAAGWCGLEQVALGGSKECGKVGGKGERLWHFLQLRPADLNSN